MSLYRSVSSLIRSSLTQSKKPEIFFEKKEMSVVNKKLYAVNSPTHKRYIHPVWNTTHKLHSNNGMYMFVFLFIFNIHLIIGLIRLSIAPLKSMMKISTIAIAIKTKYVFISLYVIYVFNIFEKRRFFVVWYQFSCLPTKILHFLMYMSHLVF